MVIKKNRKRKRKKERNIQRHFNINIIHLAGQVYGSPQV